MQTENFNIKLALPLQERCRLGQLQTKHFGALAQYFFDWHVNTILLFHSQGVLPPVLNE